MDVNAQTQNTSDNSEISSQPDPLVTQIGNCFEKFADTLGTHMNTLGNHISKNIIEAMNKSSENLRIDKEVGPSKRSHSSKAKAIDEDDNNSRRKRQRLHQSSCGDKSQTQEKRRRRVSDSESSDDGEQPPEYHLADDGVSIPSENEMNDKIRALHDDLEDTDDEEVLFKDYTKVLKDTGKTSEPVKDNLANLINTLWHQKDPLDKLKEEMAQYEMPKNCQNIKVKECNDEIWTGFLQTKHRNVDLKTQKVQKTINKGGIILGQLADNLIKLKQNKDVSVSDMKKEMVPLIQMCTDGLTFLAHGHNLLNQTRRNYITSVIPRHLSELAKNVPENSDLLFGDNIVARMNNIKAKQQALTDKNGFKNSKNSQGFSKNPENRQSGYHKNNPKKNQNRVVYQHQQQQQRRHQKKRY